MKVQEVTDIQIALGGAAMRLLPAMSHIPQQFKEDGNPWVKLTNQWFGKGLNAASFRAKEGVDKTKALRHLKAIMSSFEPKHEHKIAGVAYLMSEWFEAPAA